MAVILAATASAGPFSAVVAYGDSLADNGNFFAATGQPGPPYVGGRASNGPVAVEQLADIFGAPLLDFAWLGATTGIGNHLDPGGTPTSFGALNLPGMTTAYLASIGSVIPLAPSALFVVQGGPNDFLSPSPLDLTPFAVADRAVANIVAIVQGLQGLGAGNILVPGIPDLGLTPSYVAMGPLAAAQATALTDYFNAQLSASLPAGALYFNTADLLRAVVANPAAYGFTNVTDACFDETAPSLCSNPEEYLFWDDFHPTQRGHALLAQQFATAVPEPSTWLLMASASALLCLRRRSR